MGKYITEPPLGYSDHHLPVTLFPISPWVTSHDLIHLASLTLLAFPLGPPVLACVSKGVPGIFMDCHMMVSQPEKVGDTYFFLQAHKYPLSVGR